MRANVLIESIHSTRMEGLSGPTRIQIQDYFDGLLQSMTPDEAAERTRKAFRLKTVELDSKKKTIAFYESEDDDEEGDEDDDEDDDEDEDDECECGHAMHSGSCDDEECDCDMDESVVRRGRAALEWAKTLGSVEALPWASDVVSEGYYPGIVGSSEAKKAIAMGYVNVDLADPAMMGPKVMASIVVQCAQIMMRTPGKSVAYIKDSRELLDRSQVTRVLASDVLDHLAAETFDPEQHADGMYTKSSVTAELLQSWLMGGDGPRPKVIVTPVKGTTAPGYRVELSPTLESLYAKARTEVEKRIKANPKLVTGTDYGDYMRESAGIAEAATQIQQTAVHQIASAGSDFVNALKAKTGRVWKLMTPFLTEGDKTVYAKWQARKRPSESFGPIFSLKVTYEPSSDLYTVETRFYDGDMAPMGDARRTDGVHVESMLNPTQMLQPHSMELGKFKQRAESVNEGKSVGIDAKTRSAINAALDKAGFGGSKKWRKVGLALADAGGVIAKFGYEWDETLNANLFSGDSGTRSLHISKTNETDSFSPTQIGNTALFFQWTKLREDSFEVIAYLG
jgi:hypothetical protein